MRLSFILITLWLGFSSPVSAAKGPAVQLGLATFIGRYTGVGNEVSWFQGIQYARAPRFEHPIPVLNYVKGIHQVNQYGPGCISQGSKTSTNMLKNMMDAVSQSIWSLVLPESEHCLTINVVKPTNIKPDDKIPVVVYIYGGGFTGGNSAIPIYSGQNVVSHSIGVRRPVIFVSFNYRASAFGFLASKEIQEAGAANVGLHDQREALHWVQRNIASFGGDPTKVTLWGQSAGAISIALHMVANGGDHQNLFRAAFMQSGSTVPVTHVTKGQNDYDLLVEKTGCKGSDDTLKCLRSVPLLKLRTILRDTRDPFDYTGMADPAWAPRVDDSFIRETPVVSLRNGRVAQIPFISGCVDDEGTWFAEASLNVTDAETARKYIHSAFLTPANNAEMQTVMNLYPEDPAAGSPFNTGPANAVTSQYKRIGAFIGDLGFQAPRRQLLQMATADRWTYMFRRRKNWVLGGPQLGSFHGVDLFSTFAWGFPGAAELHWYLLNFVWEMKPNGPISKHLPEWPKYDNKNKAILSLTDEGEKEVLSIEKDNARERPVAFLIEMINKYGGHRIADALKK